MEEIMHQLIGRFFNGYSILFRVSYMSGGAVVQDFFHQQYDNFREDMDVSKNSGTP